MKQTKVIVNYSDGDSVYTPINATLWETLEYYKPGKSSVRGYDDGNGWKEYTRTIESVEVIKCQIIPQSGAAGYPMNFRRLGERVPDGARLFCDRLGLYVVDDVPLSQIRPGDMILWREKYSTPALPFGETVKAVTVSPEEINRKKELFSPCGAIRGCSYWGGVKPVERVTFCVMAEDGGLYRLNA